MILNELILRSPIRLFEQSIHGGLKSGEIGIIASQHGIGKTSVLVQIALDKLLQSKKVIHVSFSQHTQHVVTWYENIFDEFISKKGLENAADVKNELVKNRVLMNFNQDGITKEQIIKSLRAMIIEGGFKAESLIVDGLDFSRTDRERIAAVKAFARELGLSVWYSCAFDGGQQYDAENIPLVLKDFADLLDVIIILEPRNDYIELTVSKDRAFHDTAMRLDPKTLLMLDS